jgi:glycosyltransferase involved in cell wall biosynthesis
MSQPASGCADAPRERPLLFATTLDLSLQTGPSLHFLSLAKELARLGHPITVLSPRPMQAIDDTFSSLLVMRHVAAPRRVGLPSALSAVPLAVEILRSPRGSQLYLRSSPSTFLPALVVRLARGLPLIVECNGWLPDEVEMQGYSTMVVSLVGMLQRAEARLANKIRVVTEGLKATLAAEGVADAKIGVIGNGTDVARFRPLDQTACRRELGIEGDLPVLAFAGNLWPAVDLGAVLEAMAILRERGRPVRLLIAGDGVLREELERRTGAMGEGEVRFFGHLSQERTNLLLGAADVAVAPFHRRRNERIGLSPLKIRDYAAAGRPCVATELSGIEELRQEPWMFLARAENAESYAGAIAAALSSDRDSIGAAARAYAVAHFDWQVIARRVSAFIG